MERKNITQEMTRTM